MHKNFGADGTHSIQGVCRIAQHESMRAKELCRLSSRLHMRSGTHIHSKDCHGQNCHHSVAEHVPHVVA